jgi:hypothetical protein
MSPEDTTLNEVVGFDPKFTEKTLKNPYPNTLTTVPPDIGPEAGVMELM